jgi:hypothetical protein
MIEEIGIDINEVNIPDIRVYQPPGWATGANAIFAAPPVTQEVGVPVVDMPGCVEAHEQNSSKEKSGILSDDDPKGVKVYCDAGVPSFNPLDYNKDELEFKYEPQIPKVASPEQPEVTPPAATAPKTDKAVTVNCPTPAQEAKEPVGSLVEGFRKKVVAYELVGNECIQRTEAVSIPQQIVAGLPAPGVVTTTATIAVVATTSALLAKPLADLLLKVVKPTVKKVIKKIAAIRGKTVKVESLKERRGQQRIRNKAIRVLKGRE